MYATYKKDNTHSQLTNINDFEASYVSKSIKQKGNKMLDSTLIFQRVHVNNELLDFCSFLAFGLLDSTEEFFLFHTLF